jgi:hypothetical protein
MKIRNGFVSNSSSSSFLVIGSEKSDDPVAEKQKILDRLKEDHGYDYYEREYENPEKEFLEDYGYDYTQECDLIDQDQKVIARIEVDWGGESAVQQLADVLNEKFNLGLTWSWGE